VLGLDICLKKTNAILAGLSDIKHVVAEEIATHTASGALDASTDYARVADSSCDFSCRRFFERLVRNRFNYRLGRAIGIYTLTKKSHLVA